MPQQDYLHTLLGSSAVPTTTDWKSSLDTTSNRDPDDSPPSLDEFVITADVLDDAYEARRPKPKLYYDIADDESIGRKTQSVSAAWDENHTLNYTVAATKAIALRDKFKPVADVTSVRERSIFYSFVLQANGSETTPEDLHKHLLWKEFNGTEPSLEEYTNWVDTQFIEHTEPYRRTDVMIRSPVQYRPHSIPSDDPRPCSEASAVVLTTSWGAIGLTLDVEYVPESGQSLETLQSLADVLHTQSRRRPHPEFQESDDPDDPRSLYPGESDIEARSTVEIADIHHDEAVDCGYIKLIQTDDDEMLTTHTVEDKTILLDFNTQDELVGIESLSASSDFPAELLAKARKIGTESN